MTKTLKPLFAILLSLSLLLALASCAAAPGEGFYDGPMNNLSGTVNGNPSPEKGEDLGENTVSASSSFRYGKMREIQMIFKMTSCKNAENVLYY